MGSGAMDCGSPAAALALAALLPEPPQAQRCCRAEATGRRRADDCRGRQVSRAASEYHFEREFLAGVVPAPMSGASSNRAQTKGGLFWRDRPIGRLDAVINARLISQFDTKRPPCGYYNV